MNEHNPVTRFPDNPILRPSDIRPSREDMEIACVLNPGAFQYNGRTGLLLRVAERPVQEAGLISTPVIDPSKKGGLDILSFPDDECEWIEEARTFSHRGRSYLTTLSHLRLAWSDGRSNFTVDETPALLGHGPLECFGIEDCRVTQIGDTYHLHYTAVSNDGFGVGAVETSDWKNFQRHGVIIPPPNKDFALFPEKIGDYYYALHRPTYDGVGGPRIWIARSPDLLHWGGHQCVARPRPGAWDGKKLGAGASPIRTELGWLEIYHGVSHAGQYSLGLLLLDPNDPGKVLARSRHPIMRPSEPYELTGFVGNVVFTNGHIVNGDTATLYYGASDEYICGATLSLNALLATLEPQI
ncbi:MAG: glycoside hydrolase family 130 protein [Opitutaceae bacterium]|jgi:predicted GH43/DUF377 family glycosyl hydrolase|nr:glycoside hydrolase family 130 protein [Opitutaceae bacterium]